MENVRCLMNAYMHIIIGLPLRPLLRVKWWVGMCKVDRATPTWHLPSGRMLSMLVMLLHVTRTWLATASSTLTQRYLSLAQCHFGSTINAMRHHHQQTYNSITITRALRHCAIVLTGRTRRFLLYLKLTYLTVDLDSEWFDHRGTRRKSMMFAQQ